METKRIIFLHITKSAGTSLQSMLIDVYRGENILAGSLYGPGDMTLGLTAENARQYKLIMGHFDSDRVAGFIEREKCMLITFLRDPYRRFLSHYYFYKAHKENQSNEEDMQHAQEDTLKQFVGYVLTNKPNNFWNHMTYIVAGEKLWLKWREHLEKLPRFVHTIYIAIFIRPLLQKRLRELDYIGFVESFEESCRRLFSLLQIPYSKMKTLNALPDISQNSNIFQVVSMQPILNKTKQQLQSCLVLDNILYNEARKRFQ